MPTPLNTSAAPGDKVTSAQFNLANAAIIRLETNAWAVGVEPQSVPNGISSVFTFEAYEANTMALTVEGIALSRDVHFTESDPGLGQVTLLASPVLQAGDDLRGTYLRSTT